MSGRGTADGGPPAGRGRRAPGTIDRMTRSSRHVRSIAGPLLVVDGANGARLGERAAIRTPEGERGGRVIEIDGSRAVLQLLEEPRGLAVAKSEVVFRGEPSALAVSPGMLGRVFDGAGRPIDGLPPPVPEARRPIDGAPINVVSRAKPSDFVETGLSAIDGMNTLVRGQKLPIFSGAGLPAAEVAARIVRDARVAGSESFAVVFAAMGIPHREAAFYRESLAGAGALGRSVLFLNLADDPTVERLMTPRCALTTAEHLAFDHGMHVLVVLTDMTHYCEALRETSLAREELPGRRGYPGYLYTDLASLFERAGRLEGRAGSITQLPILTMPDDDITHPIPDLTGYITEGQVVLSRELQRKGIFPPIDVLPSLSRLMGLGIGEGRTRADHRGVSDQLYAFYARGCDLRRIAAIVGESGLGAEEKRMLAFADAFERELLHQPSARRTIADTLEIGWKLLSAFPREALTRISKKILEARA